MQEAHADDKEDKIMRMKKLEKGKNIMENTAEDNLNRIDEVVLTTLISIFKNCMHSIYNDIHEGV